MTFKAHLLKHECSRIAVYDLRKSYSWPLLITLNPSHLKIGLALLPGLRRVSFYILSLETMALNRQGLLTSSSPAWCGKREAQYSGTM